MAERRLSRQAGAVQKQSLVAYKAYGVLVLLVETREIAVIEPGLTVFCSATMCRSTKARK